MVVFFFTKNSSEDDIFSFFKTLPASLKLEQEAKIKTIKKVNSILVISSIFY